MTQITKLETKKEAFIGQLERHLLLPIDPHSVDLFKSLFDEFLVDFQLIENDAVAEQMSEDAAPEDPQAASTGDAQ